MADWNAIFGESGHWQKEWEHSQAVLRAFEAGCNRIELARKLNISKAELNELLLMAIERRKQPPIDLWLQRDFSQRDTILALMVHCLLGGDRQEWIDKNITPRQRGNDGDVWQTYWTGKMQDMEGVPIDA